MCLQDVPQEVFGVNASNEHDCACSCRRRYIWSLRLRRMEGLGYLWCGGSLRGGEERTLGSGDHSDFVRCVITFFLYSSSFIVFWLLGILPRMSTYILVLSFFRIHGAEILLLIPFIPLSKMLHARILSASSNQRKMRMESAHDAIVSGIALCRLPFHASSSNTFAFSCPMDPEKVHRYEKNKGKGKKWRTLLDGAEHLHPAKLPIPPRVLISVSKPVTDGNGSEEKRRLCGRVVIRVHQPHRR